MVGCLSRNSRKVALAVKKGIYISARVLRFYFCINLQIKAVNDIIYLNSILKGVFFLCYSDSDEILL